MAYDENEHGIKSPDDDEPFDLTAILGVVTSSINAPFRWALGTDSIATAGSAGITDTVALPVGLFTVPPLVLVFGRSASQKWNAKWNGTSSTSSFEVLVASGDGSTASITFNYGWLAIQMLDTAAAG